MKLNYQIWGRQYHLIRIFFRFSSRFDILEKRRMCAIDYVTILEMVMLSYVEVEVEVHAG